MIKIKCQICRKTIIELPITEDCADRLEMICSKSIIICNDCLDELRPFIWLIKKSKEPIQLHGGLTQ